MTLTPAGIGRGVVVGWPFGISAFTFGIVFGTLAAAAGVTFPEAVSMSALVFAGSVQIVAVEQWTHPLPLAALVLSALVVNARFVLMGMALRPYVTGLTWPQRCAVAFLIGDENWAISIPRFEQGETDAGIMLGSGILIFACWIAASAIGHAAGSGVADPRRWGFDFIGIAIFVALLVARWRGTKTLLPWAVAAATAVAASHWLPGKWYILVGGIAGSLVGAASRER